jgi:hypothetical protein
MLSVLYRTTRPSVSTWNVPQSRATAGTFALLTPPGERASVRNEASRRMTAARLAFLARRTTCAHNVNWIRRLNLLPRTVKKMTNQQRHAVT